MKKLLKLAAVFAAFALMFGFASCSDSDDDDDEPTSPPPGTTYSVSLYIPSLETGEYGAAETYNIGTRSSISAADLGTKLKQDKATILNSFIEMVNKEDGTQYTIDDVELRFCSEKPAEESEPEWLTTISADTAVYVVPGVGDDDDATSDALSGVWTALDYVDSTEYADKLTVSAGTTLGKVSVEGTGVQWRGGKASSSDTDFTKWNHLELGKAAAGCLKFEVGAESTVVVEAASTGGKNTSDIVLCTGTDGTGAVTGNKNTVSGSSYTTVIYSTVPAGTYYLGAFPAAADGNNRGVRIKSITVTAN